MHSRKMSIEASSNRFPCLSAALSTSLNGSPHLYLRSPRGYFRLRIGPLVLLRAVVKLVHGVASIAAATRLPRIDALIRARTGVLRTPPCKPCLISNSVAASPAALARAATWPTLGKKSRNSRRPLRRRAVARCRPVGPTSVAVGAARRRRRRTRQCGCASAGSASALMA